MRKYIFLGLFLISALLGRGQEEEMSWDKKLAITITPVSYVNLFHPYGTVNISYGISERWGIELGGGTVFPVDPWSGNEAHPVGKTNGTGYRFHLEPKFKIDSSLYVSTELYYLTYDYLSHRYDGKHSSTIIAYEVSSKVSGWNLICGARFEGDNITFEMSGGLGIKLFTVRNNAPKAISEYSSLYRLNDVFSPEENGRHLRLTIPLNMKIGVVF